MSFFANMLAGFGEIFRSPFKNTGSLWLIIPLFLLWLLLVIYFGIYSTEKMGWNTALGNGISMFWVFVSLLAYLFNKTTMDWVKAWSLLILFAYALFIVIVSFKHAINEKVFFVLASPTVLFFFSFVAVVWVYGSLVLSLEIAIDLVILFVVVLLLVEGLKALHARFIKKEGGSGEAVSSEEMPKKEEKEDSESAEPGEIVQPKEE